MGIDLGTSTVSTLTAYVSGFMGDFSSYITFIIGLIAGIFIINFLVDIMGRLALSKAIRRRDYALKEAERNTSDHFLATKLGGEGFSREEINASLRHRKRFKSNSNTKSVDEVFGIDG